jgi:hypothetical protein
MFLNLQTISKNNLIIPKEGQPITAHTRYFPSLNQRSQRVSAKRYSQF